MLSFKGNVDKEKFVEVEVVDFDGFMAELGSPVALVKMDIEGAEAPVIMKLIESGGINLIGMLIAEVHDEKIPELRQEVGALKKTIKEKAITNIELGWI